MTCATPARSLTIGEPRTVCLSIAYALSCGKGSRDSARTPSSPRVRWNEYAEHERDEAILAFEEVEAAIEHFPGADTVLVRVASVDALRDAYPSYFADTRVFVDQLKCAMG